MKYPHEYTEKALEVLEKNYFIDEDTQVHNLELLTLAAHIIDLIATSSEETEKPMTFEQVKDFIGKPIPHTS